MATTLASMLTLESWTKNMDPLVSSLFLTSNPYAFMSVIAGLMLLAKKNEAQARSEKEPHWVAPTLLVFYGLVFGVSGAGVLMALAANQGGANFFRCQPVADISITTISMKYLGYAYVATLMFEFYLMSLRAKQQRKQPLLSMLKLALWTAVNYGGLCFVATGYYAFNPFIHCIIRTVTYGFKVFENASPELKVDEKKWATPLKMFEFLMWSLVCAEQYWVYNVLSCERSAVNFAGSVVGGISAVLTLAGY